MTRIERNGMSGLLLRVAMIALAALLFGSAANAPDHGEAAVQVAALMR